MRVRTEGRVKALFLHWGPGCNAEVERRWFGDGTLIDWWDQPKVTGPQAFETIVSAARARLDDLHALTGDPLYLIAHSFGGKLAQALAESSPEKIAGITMLSCAPDPWKSYIRFAGVLSRYKPELKEASEKANQTRRPEDLWKLVQIILQISEFKWHYFKNDETRARYAAFSNGAKFMDFGVFEDVLSEFVGPQPKPKKIDLPKGVPVQCFLGEHDPMVSPEDAKAWQQIYPHFELRRVPEAAHFVHFETPPSTWLGKLTSSFRL